MKKIKKYLGIVLAIALVLAMMPTEKMTSAVTPGYNSDEFGKIQGFLNQVKDGKSNGEIMNPLYNPDDITTWFGITWEGAEEKHVTGINWTSMGLFGSLDVSNFSKLDNLKCTGNKLTELNVQNSSIYFLDCSDNELTSLKMAGANNLNYLDCTNNLLTALDLSGKSNLDFLHCAINKLTSLDVSVCNGIYRLDCSDNDLTTLNLSGTSSLSELNCSKNELTSLDTRANDNHTFIDCSNNQLSSLEIGGCSELSRMDCSHNRLRRIEFGYYGSYIDLDARGDGFVSFSLFSGDGEFTLEIVAEANTGATFQRWMAQMTEISEPIKSFLFMPEHDYNYTAYFTGSEVTRHTVEFDPNGGVLVSGDRIQYVQDGGSATEPVVRHYGYDFVGWDKEFDNVTSDLTVKAIWIIGSPEISLTPTPEPIIFYSVIFDPDGGKASGTIPLFQSVQEHSYALAPTVEKEGYNFIRWDSPFDNVTRDITVKALWEKIIITHQVTFDRNGGIRKGGGQVIQTVVDGEAAVAPELRRYGYTFDGWDKTFENITEDITVTAKWVKNDEPVVGEKYTVTYDVNGGDGEPPIDITEYAKGDSASLADDTGISKEGYEFAGWSYEPDGEAIADPEIVIEDNVTLYAVWVAVEAEPTAVPVDETGDIPKTGVASGAYFGLAMLAFGGGVVVFEAVRKRRMKKA